MPALALLLLEQKQLRSNFVKDLCSEFHKKIIIGIDAKNGKVATEVGYQTQK